MNSTTQVLNILRKQGRLSSKEALETYGIHSLRKRIFDLRASGHQIDFQFGRYYLIEKSPNDVTREDHQMICTYASKYVRQLLLNLENKAKNRSDGMTDAMEKTKQKLEADLLKISTVL